MEIGNRLRFFRIQKNMTQEELASTIISVSYLSKIENNQAVPSTEVLEMLYKKLGIAMDEKEEYSVLKKLNDWYHLIVQKKEEEATSFFHEYEEEFQNSNDSNTAILYVLFKLRFLIFTNKLDEAKYHVDKINKFKDIFDQRMNFYYHKFLADLYFLQARYHVALDHYKQSEEILTSSIQFESWQKGDFHYYIGLAYYYTGNIALSIINTQLALKIFQSAYELRRSAECQTMLGLCYQKIDEHHLSETHFRMVLNIAESMKDEYLLNMIHHNLGILYEKQKKPHEAVEEIKKGLLYVSDSEVIKKLRSIHALLGLYYHQLGDIENCRKWLNQGKEIIEKTRIECDYAIHITFYDHLLNNPEKIERFIVKEAIPYFERMENVEKISIYAEYLADYYQEKHKYKLASYYYSIVVKYNRKHLYV